MDTGKGSRTDLSDDGFPSIRDEEALLDRAMRQADSRLVDSLKEDELRRRRKRRWLIGGCAMTITITGIIIGSIKG